MFSTFLRKKNQHNLNTNCYDNHEYLYDTSQTRAQRHPSVWSWLMGSLHMYPFRLNGSYLVIFCHMYTTHSRLNVSKSSYRIIISNQMVSIWPWTHAIHICLAFFIVVLMLNIRITYFQKKPNLLGWLNQLMNGHKAKPMICDKNYLWASPHLPLYFWLSWEIFLTLERNLVDCSKKSCWESSGRMLESWIVDCWEILVRTLSRDAPNVHFPDICKGLTRWCW